MIDITIVNGKMMIIYKQNLVMTFTVHLVMTFTVRHGFAMALIEIDGPYRS